MWPIKGKENKQLFTLWSNLCCRIRRYGSLININPSAWDNHYTNEAQ